jgi:hypothetical protein
VSWREIYPGPPALSPARRALARAARGLGVLLMRPRLEAWLRIRGTMVAVMEKPA